MLHDPGSSPQVGHKQEGREGALRLPRGGGGLLHILALLGVGEEGSGWPLRCGYTVDHDWRETGDGEGQGQPRLRAGTLAGPGNMGFK